MATPALFAAIDLDPYIQGIVVFLFVILPVLRSILAERGKREQAPTAKPGPRQAGRRELGDKLSEGRELWERLLRGELPQPPSAPPAPRAEPRAAPRATPAAVRPERAVREARVERTNPENLLEAFGPPRDQPPMVEAPQLEGFASRALAPDELPPVPSEEEIESQVRARDVAPGPGAHAGIAGLELQPSAALAVEPMDEPARRPRSGDPSWRRAWVLLELLGPPVALRDRDRGAGSPPGFG